MKYGTGKFMQVKKVLRLDVEPMSQYYRKISKHKTTEINMRLQVTYILYTHSSVKQN